MLLTRLPLGIATPFDLHVLGTPPALILSQDQTLHKKSRPTSRSVSSYEPFEALKVLTKLDSRLHESPIDRRCEHPRPVKFVRSTVSFRDTGGAGARGDRLNSRYGDTLKNAAFAAHLSVSPCGDPQTYALLHCSVFKERTLTSGPLRTGSLTAPGGRDVRVTAAIVSPRTPGVNPFRLSFCE